MLYNQRLFNGMYQVFYHAISLRVARVTVVTIRFLTYIYVAAAAVCPQYLLTIELCMRDHRLCSFHQCTVESLCYSILFLGIWHNKFVTKSFRFKVFLIFAGNKLPTIICSKPINYSPRIISCDSLKLLKFCKNFRFLFEKVHHAALRIIIYKCCKILVHVH